MARVLVVDTDVNLVEQLEQAVSAAGHTPNKAFTFAGGLSALVETQPEVVLAADTDPGGAAIDLFTSARSRGSTAEFILAVKAGSVRTAVEATRLGVFECIERPVCSAVLSDALQRAICQHGGRMATCLQLPGFQRWATMVVTAIRSPHDLRTVAHWARALGLSRPTLERQCRAVGISAKLSLDFARFIRAMSEARRHQCPAEVLVNCDPRTFQRLARRARVSFDPHAPEGITFKELIEAQGLITDQLALSAVKCQLTEQFQGYLA